MTVGAMTFIDYRAIPAVNWSSLKALRRSPLHYQHGLTVKREPTDAMKLGRLFHTLTLEAEMAADEYIAWDGGTRRGAKWDAFCAEHFDREILTRSAWDSGARMAAAVRRNPIAAALLEGSSTEHTITWTDPPTGIECKGRLDLVNGRLVDLKSSAEIAPHRFAKTAAQLGYHGQLAYYQDGCCANDLGGDEMPLIIAVESSPPHDVIIYEPSEAFIEAGRSLYQGLLERLVECQQVGEWPGIGAGETVPLSLPAWAATEADEGEPSLTIGGEKVEV